MPELEPLRARAQFDASQALTSLGRLNSSVGTLQGSLRTAGVALAGFVTVKGVQLLRESVEAFKEQENAVNRLEAALGTAGTAGRSALDGLIERAGELQRVTLAGDEAIIAATADLRLLATALTPEDLARAQEALIGIADTFLKGDLTNAASLLGKTIGSTTNALTRYGIQVDTNASQSEKLWQVLEQTRGMFEVSKASVFTLAGAQKQLENATGDLREEIGSIVVDLVQAEGATRDITSVVQDFTGWVQENRDEIIRWGRAVTIAFTEGAASVGRFLTIARGLAQFNLLAVLIRRGAAIDDIKAAFEALGEQVTIAQRIVEGFQAEVANIEPIPFTVNLEGLDRAQLEEMRATIATSIQGAIDAGIDPRRLVQFRDALQQINNLLTKPGARPDGDAQKLADALKALNDQLDIEVLRLLEGEEAARRHELRLRGLSDATIENVIQTERFLGALERQRDFLREVAEFQRRGFEPLPTETTLPGRLTGALRELERIQVVGRNAIAIGADMQEVLDRWGVTLDELPPKVRAFFEAFTAGKSEVDAVDLSLSETLQRVTALAQGVELLARAFAGAGDQAQRASGFIQGVVGGISSGAAVGGTAGGIAGGVLGAIGGIAQAFSDSGATLRRELGTDLLLLSQDFEALRRATSDLAQQFGGADLLALERFGQIEAREFRGLGPDDFKFIFEQLVLRPLNFTLADLKSAADATGISIRNLTQVIATGEGDADKAAAELEALVGAIGLIPSSAIEAAVALRQLRDQLDDISFVAALFDLSAAEQFVREFQALLGALPQKFIEQVLGPELLAQFDTAGELLTEEGLAAAREALRRFAGRDESGKPTGPIFGDDISDIILGLDRLLEEIARGNERSDAEGRRNTGFVASRTISAVQANQLNAGVTTLSVQFDQSLTLAQERNVILTDIRSILSGGAVPPFAGATLASPVPPSAVQVPADTAIPVLVGNVEIGGLTFEVHASGVDELRSELRRGGEETLRLIESGLTRMEAKGREALGHRRVIGRV